MISTEFSNNHFMKVFLPNNQTSDKQNIVQPVSNVIQFSNRPTFYPR
jgi:hypothetical protein